VNKNWDIINYLPSLGNDLYPEFGKRIGVYIPSLVYEVREIAPEFGK